MKRIPFLAAATLVFSLSAQALENCTISPSSGPTSGGNTVTIRCDDLGDWPYGVIFGETPAASTQRTAPDTLVAVAPAHLPGSVEMALFEYDRGIPTELAYEFLGDVPEQLDRFLLPIYLPPIPGAFGSEFVTAFRARKEVARSITLTGVHTPDNTNLNLPSNGYQPEHFVYTGTPGRFFYVKSEDADDFGASLHVYDTSRAGENRGTQIPIVRESAFDTRHLLLGVPTDPLYRNTLRIYGTQPVTVIVTIGDAAPVTVQLSGAEDVFHPAYAQLTAFPIGTEMVDVKIEAPAPVWAFISTTNNATQLITTITP